MDWITAEVAIGFVVGGVLLLAVGGWACYCLGRGAPDAGPGSRACLSPEAARCGRT